MASAACWSHVWVGAENGALKGVNLQRREAKNHLVGGALSRAQAISALCWRDPTETQLLVASLDRCVKVFSPEQGRFTSSRQCPGGEGDFCGLAAYEGSILTCVESGLVRLWRDGEAEPGLELAAGPGLCRMRQDPTRPQRIGTGGRENSLKLWDLQRPQEAIFRAKNVRNDWLDLRVPIWDRDLHFLPGSDRVLTCTAHSQVRLYDPSTPQRRPQLEVSLGGAPLTALAVLPGHSSVAVGSAQGDLTVLDLRMGRVLGALKGLAGSVRALQCHPQRPLLASCGLDRCLRLHHLRDRSLRHKVYLRSRLFCLLLSTQRDWEAEEKTPPEGEGKEEEEEEEEGEEDALWATMETIGTPQGPLPKAKRGKKRKLLGGSGVRG